MSGVCVCLWLNIVIISCSLMENISKRCTTTMDGDNHEKDERDYSVIGPTEN